MQQRPRRSRHASDGAFECLYERHATSIYQYALAVMANPADAEDVTQMTFMNAYRAFQRGERPRLEHNWLIKIAHNVCRMRWRESQRRPELVPLDEVREPAVIDEDSATVEDVLRALTSLPFTQRSALVMRELEDRSYREIADTLDVSVGAVEALLFRARRNLQLKRKSLGVLGTAPLPPALSSFGGGASVVAASVVGTPLTLKVIGLLGAGILAGTAGYVGLEAIPQHPAPERALVARAPSPAPHVLNALQPAGRQKLGSAQFGHTPRDSTRWSPRPSNARLTLPVISPGPATAPAAAGAAAVSPAPVQLPEPPAKAAPTPGLSPPPLSPPPLPPPPSSPPSLPAPPTLPPTPTLPVVSVPTLPIPVPPLPKLP
ncbi:MAG: RNA polymerase sigma factor [Gaiellaceae bacterium]